MPLFGPPNIEKLKAKGNVRGLIRALGYKKNLVVERKDVYLYPETVKVFQQAAALRLKAARALGQLGDARALEPLLDALLDEDQSVRTGASEALAQIGVPALEPLIAALEDEDADVRAGSALALGQMGDPRAVAALSTTLGDKIKEVRASAAVALGQIGKASAHKVLIKALEDSAAQVRRAAAEALGLLGDARAEKALTAVLTDKDRNTREAAAQALAQLGGPAAKSLFAALEDPDRNVRLNAIEALGQSGQIDAVQPLLGALKDECAPVRQAAAKALDQLGWQPDGSAEGAAYWVAQSEWQRCVRIGKPAVQALVAVLEDKDSKVRQAAATALDELGWQPGKGAKAAAYWMAKRDWEQCVQVGSPAVNALIIALEAKDTRQPAVIALGKTGNRRAVKPLVATLKDREQEVRIAAVQALGQIGNAHAVEPLLTAIRNEGEILCQDRGRGTTAKLRRRAKQAATDELRRRAELLYQAAVLALAQIGVPAVGPLIAALKEPHVYQSQCAQQALVQIGAPAAKPLVAQLQYSNPGLRRSVIQALEQIGQPAVKPLIPTLLHRNREVRQIAAEMLDKLGWEPDQGESEAVYWIAKTQWDRCIAIGLAAVGPLITALKDWDSQVRKSAAHSLGEIGDPGALEALCAALKDKDENVRLSAARSLGQIGDARAVNPLSRALKDQQEGVRAAAVYALAQIGDAQAVVPLGRALKNEDEFLRPRVAEILGQFGDPRATKPLIAALKDRDEDTRRAAAMALVSLYQSGCLDEADKQAVLALRSTIVGTSRPHQDETVLACVSEHQDRPAIDVEFPL